MQVLIKELLPILQDGQGSKKQKPHQIATQSRLPKDERCPSLAVVGNSNLNRSLFRRCTSARVRGKGRTLSTVLGFGFGRILILLGGGSLYQRDQKGLNVDDT